MNIDAYDIVLPDHFVETIQRGFGAEGEAWLSRLGGLVRRCAAKWDLDDCHLADHLSFNLVCFCTSPEYGRVALKVGVPHAELYTEITALSLFRGPHVCRCYDADVELGAMLLERIVPGYDLKAVQDRRACVDIAADVIAHLPQPVRGSPPLPYFSEWLEGAFSRARREGKVGERMLFYVDQAERLYERLAVDETSRVLLHGDLHHENVLYSETGQWKAIDPKGAIGFACMEAARFIRNHLADEAPAARWGVMDELVGVFGAAFERPERTIAVCAFVDCVLSRCWTFEGYLPAEALAEVEAEAIGSCAFYLDYVGGDRPDRLRKTCQVVF